MCWESANSYAVSDDITMNNHLTRRLKEKFLHTERKGLCILKIQTINYTYAFWFYYFILHMSQWYQTLTSFYSSSESPDSQKKLNW